MHREKKIMDTWLVENYSSNFWNRILAGNRLPWQPYDCLLPIHSAVLDFISILEKLIAEYAGIMQLFPITVLNVSGQVNGPKIPKMHCVV